jgi:hypothetical protein
VAPLRGTADSEEGDLPQRRQGILREVVAVAGITRLAHRDHGGQPDEAAGRVEHEERERQLDDDRGGDAEPHVGRARVEHDVEPRVTAQQRASDDQAGDDDLAAAPERPAGRGERGELDEIEPDPGALPVLGVERTVQGEAEHDDPADQHGARNDRREDPKAAASCHVDPQHGVRVVDGGERVR